jgi:DNA-binding transcriptional MerR regulator
VIVPVHRSLAPGTPDADPTTSAARTLRELGMPRDEIETILETHDDRLVHRYLELHRERLEEWLAEQREVLARIEPVLAAGQLAPTGTRGRTKGGHDVEGAGAA